MARSVIIDEIHLTLRVPADLADDRTDVIRRTLRSDDFMRRLLRAVRAVVRAHPELNVVRVSVTR